MSKVIHVEISDDEHHALRQLSLDRRLTLGVLTAQALRTAPATREAFQTKDGQK